MVLVWTTHGKCGYVYNNLRFLLFCVPFYGYDMPFIDVAILAVVQGLTEFLPVSSTGHLLAARMLFGFSDAEGNAFDAFLHLGTLAAVLIYFRTVWWGIVRDFFIPSSQNRERRVLALQLVVATVPAALAGYVWRDVFETHFRSPEAVSLSFLATAFVLTIADVGRRSTRSVRDLTFTDVLFIGVAQILALVPAVSRSGMTMAAGRARGLSRYEAATFSFLLSAPIIFGAGLFSLRHILESGTFSSAELAVGFLVSFAAGMAAIHAVLTLVQRMSFTPFVIYLLVVAGVMWYVR